MIVTIVVAVAVLAAVYLLRRLHVHRTKAEADATALKASAEKVVTNIENDAKAEATKVEAHL
jgi:hypothetical protein